jgi:hypothetical protein
MRSSRLFPESRVDPAQAADLGICAVLEPTSSILLVDRRTAVFALNLASRFHPAGSMMRRV